LDKGDKDAREPSVKGLSQITFLIPLRTWICISWFSCLFSDKIFFPKMFPVVWIQRNAVLLVFLAIGAVLFFTISIDEMKLAFQIRQVNIHYLFILNVSGFQENKNDNIK
jgi:hypothetical protein